MSQDEIGTLIVVVLKARNLNDKHKFRKQDAFAKISLNGVEKTTNVEIKGGQHPVWDQEFRIPILKSTGKKFRTLEVSCWSKEPRSDDLLGKGSIDISETLRTGEFDDWIPLNVDGVIRGDLYLEMTYYANGPPPPGAAPPPQAIDPKPVANAYANKPANTHGGGLLVPQGGAGLMRRPSKLSPSERLSRPVATLDTILDAPVMKPLRQGSNGTADPRLSAYPSSPAQPYSDHRRPSNAPVPTFLRPGAVPTVPRPISDPIITSSPNRLQSPVQANSGTSPPKSNPYLTGVRPSHHRTASAGTPAPNPYLTSSTPVPPVYNTHTPGPTTAPSYGQPPQSHTPVPQYPPQSQPTVPQYPPQSHTPVPPGHYPPQQHHSAQYQPAHTPVPPQYTPPYGIDNSSAPSIIWTTDHGASNNASPAGGFAFPMPSTSPGSYSQPFNHVSPPHVAPYRPVRQASDPRDDPSLRVRYQTPLPLPPGATRDARDARSPPNILPASPPKPPAQTPPVQTPVQTPPVQTPPRQPSPDDRRVSELKWYEKEAARRREQELKDMELAMQLDKELNMS